MATLQVIKKSMLQADLLGGLKRKEIAHKYGISPGVLTKLMKKAGLLAKRAASTPVEFVNDVDAPVEAPAATE